MIWSLLSENLYSPSNGPWSLLLHFGINITNKKPASPGQRAEALLPLPTAFSTWWGKVQLGEDDEDSHGRGGMKGCLITRSR